MTLTENEIEQYTLDLLTKLGYQKANGLELTEERRSNNDVVLVQRLKNAIERLNPDLNPDAREEALKKVLRTESPNLMVNNEYIHCLMVDGVDVEYREGDRIKGDKAWLIDFKNPENNEFLAVNQFSITENGIPRRPDLIIFVNGIPLVIVELKNLASEKATVAKAFEQLQTYKKELKTLFQYNAFLIVSDGIESRVGSISSDWSRFMRWKSPEKYPKHTPEMVVMFQELLNKKTLIDFLKHFIVFEKDKKNVIKKLAAYHQYYAVNKAITSTKKASAEMGDRRCGVVWHTQGSGKSLSMVFYTGKLVLELNNPTIVILTDRNDLDDQLFATFSNCMQLLRQKPVQAEKRSDLQKLLSVASGGVVFTTIQKFLPENDDGIYPALTERRNVIVIADEAHRSQYGFNKKIKLKEDGSITETYGMAKYLRDALPNASFIGFTGTPVELTDKSTPAVFGDYIDIYDIEQAVEDEATVRIYYESRLAKLHIKEEEKDNIDPEFDEVTENQEENEKQLLKSKWAKVEAIVGNPERLKDIAKDLVNHFEERTSVLQGKGMIVCMSRRICVELYNHIIALRPEWHDENDEKGFIKVIMTGSASDNASWQQHIRNKAGRRLIADRMKDPDNSLKLVIVRDMWLTGFDAPSIHTMYNDKPMKGHNLMQAIARVNRVFKNKSGGLIVDYLGIASDLKFALTVYTESGGKGKPSFDQGEAVAVMQTQYEIVCNLFDKFDYKSFFTADTGTKLSIILAAEEHILQLENGVERYIEHVDKLLKAYTISVPHTLAMDLRDEVALFQTIKSRLVKVSTEAREKSDEEIDSAIKQIVSKAVASDGVIDIFDAAGLKKPDISILSDSFLEEVKGMKHKNLAFEALKQLLNNEIKNQSKNNLVQSKTFSKMLEDTIKKYQNKTIEVTEVLNNLVELGKNMRESIKRGEELGLSPDELAFYDALEVNDSAVKILGDEQLRAIARDLVKSVRSNATIDWTIKESVQSKMKRDVKRLLSKHGYPPDKQLKATETVLKQAELLSENWVNNLTEEISVPQNKIINYQDYVQSETPEVKVALVETPYKTEKPVEKKRELKIDSLIWPLSSAYLMATENNSEVQSQTEYLYRTFELAIAFNATVLLSALPKEERINCDEEIWGKDKKVFSKTSFGLWLELYRRLSNVYQHLKNKDGFVESLPFELDFFLELSNKKLIEKLGKIVTIRNKKAHSGVKPDSILKNEIDEMLVILSEFYQALSVYQSLNLIYTKSMKNKGGFYHITTKKLDGPRYPFTDKVITVSKDMESDTLYLYDPITQNRLAIIPELVRMIECEQCGNNSVYFFSKIVNKRAEYTSYFNEIHSYNSEITGLLNEFKTVKSDEASLAT